MLFCMGARAIADEIVDSNTFFPHLMMATSAFFTYVDLYRRLLSNYRTYPKFTCIITLPISFIKCATFYKVADIYVMLCYVLFTIKIY